MLIKTSDKAAIKLILDKYKLPKADSHKGQNGRVLIIGGSSLFHSASIWAAEVASHFVDIVHYASTKENEEIFLDLKKKFHNGIIVPQKDLMRYVSEDNAVLVGSGMMRTDEEGKYTYDLTKKLLESFPNKRFVLDAGSLQTMPPDWLSELKVPAIVTPHQQEFEKLFSLKVIDKSLEEKQRLVQTTAKKYHCIILLKAVSDIVSDGKEIYVVEGGNQGLTKGGTGDVLAGLTVGFYANNPPLLSAVLASFLLKKTAEELSKKSGYWYNIDNIVEALPSQVTTLILKE